MRTNIKALLAQKGYAPIFSSIDKSIQDLKRAKYTKEEIKETIVDMFGGDSKLDEYINAHL